MEIVVGLLSLWAGSWKSVSVCGVNAAFVARPSAGASRRAIGAYAAGLLLGALTVTIAIAVLGAAVNTALRVPFEVRATVAGTSCLLLGAGEIVRGAWLLPHIGWAVPRRWATTLPPALFLSVFGLVRGVALFNHSPFASFHAWAWVLFLLHDALPVAVSGALLALGLALWTMVYGIVCLGRGNRQQVLDTLAPRSLATTRELGRIDGLALLAVGAVILAPH
jgi:hypothetical protein